MTELFVRISGSGPPIVFLHGWTCHSGFFRPQAEGLSSDYGIIRPDMPGHGKSAHVDRRTTLDDLAASIDCVLTEHTEGNAVLVAWSMGAAAAFNYIRHQGCGSLAGLVIVDMTPKVFNDDTWSLGIRNRFDATRSSRAEMLMLENWDAYARPIARNIFAEHQNPDPDLLDWTHRQVAANDPLAMVPLWRAVVRSDNRDVLPLITVPTLVVSGAQSQLYSRETARYMVEQIDDADMIAFAHSGHAPHLEEPDAFNAAIRAFMTRL